MFGFMQIGDPPFLLIRIEIELVEAVGFADDLVPCMIRHRARHAYISLPLGFRVDPVYKGIEIGDSHGAISEFSNPGINFRPASA